MAASKQYWHALLVLGRASNLPTVWSNCFAGWYLGGGGDNWWPLIALLVGATLLYTAGMYLNDVVDVEFDLQHRHERPIPAGHVPLKTVRLLTVVYFVLGMGVFVPFGRPAVILTGLLVTTIIVYDVVHKWVTFSPVIMAGCRFWLFLLAAHMGQDGISGHAMWAAVVLALYVVGLSYIARRESLASPIAAWPCYLMATPILLCLLVNNGDYRIHGIVLSLLLVAWVLGCLRHTFWSGSRNVGRTVSGLLAGIVIVDVLAVGVPSTPVAVGFAALLALALLFQRYIPAT